MRTEQQRKNMIRTDEMRAVVSSLLRQLGFRNTDSARLLQVAVEELLINDPAKKSEIDALVAELETT